MQVKSLFSLELHTLVTVRAFSLISRLLLYHCVTEYQHFELLLHITMDYNEFLMNRSLDPSQYS
jgi:hypothetical protein